MRSIAAAASRRLGFWRTHWSRAIAMLLLAAGSMASNPLFAAESAPVVTARTTASLVSDADIVQPGTPLKLALRLQIAPGWHTYWRNPGDAGIPPELSVELPDGGQVGPLEWPVPTRIAEGTLTTFGYRGDLLLPISVTPETAPITIRAHASWLVCRDLCVPESADFSLALPAGPSLPSPQAPLFAAADRQIPRHSPFTASITPAGTLTLAGPGLPTDVTSIEFYPSDDGATEGTGPVKPATEHGALSFQTRLSSGPKLGASVAGVVALTTATGTQGYDIAATVVPAPAGGEPLLVLLALAVAGGLLLNLMPCVFPILAMKAIALARMSGASRRTIRMEAISYSAGVVVAFAALGLGLAALRQAGQVAGWGFQFQSPVFVIAVAWLLFATGLNLSGVFTVGEGIAGSGQSLARLGGHWGSFFTGLLAVLVATPCTASFMGIAIAGALAAAAPPVSALIFAAMGIGLALPYALVAAFPRTTHLLPRPGAWMGLLRQVLAFPMYGATAWLVWVASQQSGSQAVLTALIGLIGVGFAAWLYGVTQASSRTTRRWAGAGVAITTVLIGVLLASGSGSGASEASEPFTPARLAELRSEGRPVFVNMTAAWCLSCLVNERLALSPQATRDAFARSHVAYLKGDWTRQDPAISDFLREHGRDGVPLYVYYPPGKPPAVLPQILTEGLLLHEIAGS